MSQQTTLDQVAERTRFLKEFMERPETQTLIRLLKQIRMLWGVLIFSILSRFLNQISTIAVLTLAAWALGQVIVNPNPDVRGHILVELILIGALKSVFIYLEHYMGHYVAFRLMATMRNMLYERLELLAPAGLTQARSGDIVSRAVTDIDRLEVFYSHTIAAAVIAVLVPLLSLYVMATFSIWLAIAFVPFLVGVGVILPWWFDRESKHDTYELSEATSSLSAHLTDNIQGLREIVLTGSELRKQEEIHTQGEHVMQVRARLAQMAGKQDAFTDVVISASLVCLLALGLVLTGLGWLPATDLPAVLALAITTFGPVTGASNVIHRFNQSIASADRLFALMDMPPLVRETATTAPAETVEPSIEFDKVFFRYPLVHVTNNGYVGDETPYIHTDLSFHIAAGRTVAIVGASGAGKTTVVNLLLRFWDTEQGRICIGGFDIRDYPLEDIRRMIAVVSQNTYIFNATIKENLLVGRPGATDSEIEQAARQANIHDFIVSLPDGYKTRVGEMGSRFSTGQRQRLAIARALLKNAPILVLDEATSNLDAATEREIQAALQGLMQGRTTLVIAHRLSTVINADEIFVMEDGRIVEQGEHRDLVSRNGAYAQLFARQRDERVSLGS